MSSIRKDLLGQVAIVTGAARGIGLGIAKRLFLEGCRVVIWDRDPAAFDSSSAGFDATALIAVDVADAASVRQAMALTLKSVDRVDILVNNAGINGRVANVWEYPEDDWGRVIAVNLTGVFNCCKTVVPTMRTAQSGRIINVASIAGKEGMPGIAAYAASKAGMIGFTKSLAKELTHDGVLVNCIAPVITETDLFKEMTPEHIASAKSKIPMGRFLTIEEIAATVAWIANPECSFNTGFTFDLSGGRATY